MFFFYFLYNFYILYAKFSIFICIFIIYYLIFSASRQFIPYIIIYFFFLLAFFKNISYFKPDLFFTARKIPQPLSVTQNRTLSFSLQKTPKSLYLSTINLFWFPWHERTYEIRDSGFVTSR